jgi:hypothetical protein
VETFLAPKVLGSTSPGSRNSNVTEMSRMAKFGELNKRTILGTPQFMGTQLKIMNKAKKQGKYDMS